MRSGAEDPPSGDPEDTIAPDASTSEVVDVVSGKPLSDFEGSPDYEWRSAIAEDPDGIVGQLQEVAPHLGEEDLSAVLETCTSLAAGDEGTGLVDETVERFSGDAGEDVTPEQARALVGVTQTEVCP